ncbi:MAG: sel1 repeat family protein [Deltaproteobacteria bacterium]|nr:sel1 repeat family protein [Deltaproteobacteria bacterium]
MFKCVLSAGLLLAVAATGASAEELDFEKEYTRSAASCRKADMAGCFDFYALCTRLKPQEDKKIFNCLKVLQVACDKKNGAACNMLGQVHLVGQGTTKYLTKKKALQFFERGCTLKNKDACVHLFEMATGAEEGYPVSVQRGLKYAGKACLLGDADACSAIVYAYDEGGDLDTGKAPIKKNKKLARQWADRACLVNFDFCDSAIQIRTDKYKDRETAAKKLKADCRRKDIVACLACTGYVAGEEIQTYYRRACDLGNVPSCALFADMVMDHDPKLALKYLERACNKRHADTCGKLGMLYMEGTADMDAKVARKKALSAFQRACKLGLQGSCVIYTDLSSRKGEERPRGDSPAAEASPTPAPAPAGKADPAPTPDLPDK